jgi:hypothetical protein
MTGIPHLKIIIAFCAAAIFGYAVFSVWAVFYSTDVALRGDVGGTWKSFAVAAFAFWLGSSSGGKTKSDGPVPVTVRNTPEKPVMTRDASEGLPEETPTDKPEGES